MTEHVSARAKGSGVFFQVGDEGLPQGNTLAADLEKDTRPPAPWPGIDETVIEKIAADAGCPAREPYINTDQGDLLLFLFLVAGAVGGFIAGYTFRGLFPPKLAERDVSRT